MPRFCYPLIEIRLKLKTGCQDHQAGESAVKCLFQGHKRMVGEGFELRLCRLQSRRSKHSTTMLTKQYLFVFYLVNFFPEHSLFLPCVHLLLAQSHFFTLQFVKQPAAIIVAVSWSLRDFSVVLIKYSEFKPFVCSPWVGADVSCKVRQLCVFYVWFLICFIYLQNTASFRLSLFSFYIKHLWLFWLFPLSKQNRVIRLFTLRQSASLSAFYRYNQFFNPLIVVNFYVWSEISLPHITDSYLQIIVYRLFNFL